MKDVIDSKCVQETHKHVNSSGHYCDIELLEWEKELSARRD
jgi:hypothetical protein